MVNILRFMAITSILGACEPLGARIEAGARCVDFIRHPQTIHKPEETWGSSSAGWRSRLRSRRLPKARGFLSRRSGSSHASGVHCSTCASRLSGAISQGPCSCTGFTWRPHVCLPQACHVRSAQTEYRRDRWKDHGGWQAFRDVKADHEKRAQLVEPVLLADEVFGCSRGAPRRDRGHGFAPILRSHVCKPRSRRTLFSSRCRAARRRCSSTRR